MTEAILFLLVLYLLRENWLLIREVRHWEEAYGRKD